MNKISSMSSQHPNTPWSFPSIVAVIAGQSVSSCVDLARRAQTDGADILELRADFCDAQDPVGAEKLVARIKECVNLPILLTVRRFSEGGYFAGDEVDRLKLFKRLANYVDAADVELYATEIRNEVIDLFKSQGKLVLTSYHNFIRTPPVSKIDEIVEDAVSFDADMVKIALAARSEADVKFLTKYTAEFEREILLTTISMGDVGTISRILNPFLGSCFTYGCIGEATTPGQIPVKELRGLMDEFSGMQIHRFEEVDSLLNRKSSNQLVEA